MTDDYPDPTDWAQAYNCYDSPGVRRDVLVDARIEAESLQHQVTEAYVTLDALVDSNMMPTPVQRQAAELASELREVASWLDDLAVELDRLETEAKADV
jgi:hypothetical protein